MASLVSLFFTWPLSHVLAHPTCLITKLDPDQDAVSMFFQEILRMMGFTEDYSMAGKERKIPASLRPTERERRVKLPSSPSSLLLSYAGSVGTKKRDNNNKSCNPFLNILGKT